MDASRDDVLVYMDFPKEHGAQISSTNLLERVNKEIKRRSDVVGIFPNDDAIIRLVEALMLEQNDEWAVARRYMALESLARIVDDAPVRLPAVATGSASDLSGDRWSYTTPWDMTFPASKKPQFWLQFARLKRSLPPDPGRLNVGPTPGSRLPCLRNTGPLAAGSSAGSVSSIHSTGKPGIPLRSSISVNRQSGKSKALSVTISSTGPPNPQLVQEVAGASIPNGVAARSIGRAISRSLAAMQLCRECSLRLAGALVNGNRRYSSPCGADSSQRHIDLGSQVTCQQPAEVEHRQCVLAMLSNEGGEGLARLGVAGLE